MTTSRTATCDIIHFKSLKNTQRCGKPAVRVCVSPYDDFWERDYRCTDAQRLGTFTFLCQEHSTRKVFEEARDIPLAEAKELIEAVGTHMLDMTCRLIISWSAEKVPQYCSKPAVRAPFILCSGLGTREKWERFKLDKTNGECLEGLLFLCEEHKVRSSFSGAYNVPLEEVRELVAAGE